MASPVHHKNHGSPHADLLGWLSVYKSLTPGVDSGDNSSDRLDEDSMPQPDGLLRLPSSVGGTSHVAEDGILEGPPELCTEVAASSASYDLHDKLDVYRRHGVQEYLVWLVLEHRFLWFMLESGRYVPIEPDEEGVIRSRVFPGLNLDTDAMLRGDLASVFNVVREGCDHAEHAELVARLDAAASQG